MISGHTDQVKDCDLARAGVDHFLPKPLDLELLVEILEQVRTREAPIRKRGITDESH